VDDPMPTPVSKQPAGDSAPRPFLPLLLVLFVGSGCSALIYEIVWFQLLQFVIGSSAVSLGVLLGTFMGGMCLGSILLPRVVSARRHPLEVYAFLELGIGIIGLLILHGMPYVGALYLAGAAPGLAGVLLRGLVCAVCLLPPTVLMGATLPAVARWIETTPQGVSWLGFFYGGNIAGAVFGCLLAGFYLLRAHDTATASYVAGAMNAAVGLVGLVLAGQIPYGEPARRGGLGKAIAPGSRLTYPSIALSGLCALSAEVIWTRVLSLLLGATVYTFSIILAVFLIGLGVGSALGSLVGRRTARPGLALGICQLLIAAAVAWTALMLTKSLPYWPIDVYIAHSPWVTFQMDLVRCLWAILPAAVLWGASFPLALAAVASRGQDAGRLVGSVYAANTAGAIVGALGSSLFFIQAMGTRAAQQTLIAVSAAAAVLMFASLLFPSAGPVPRRRPAWELPVLLMGAALGLAIALVVTVAEVPGELVAWGRQLPKRQRETDVVYVGEGLNSSVAVTQRGTDVRLFHVSGKVEASTYPEDMRLQRMLGHLSALATPHPQKVLVVGCGAGVTAGAFVKHPGVERIVICEIEPLIPKVVATHFAEANHDVLKDRRVEIVYDDARHHVLTTREKFDVITSDPIHPWVKGAATLYTQEYFELCKRQLNPGGVVTLWVPLYESDVDTVKSELATFFEVFPHGTLWTNSHNGEGYDTVALGHAEPTKIDIDGFEERLSRSDHSGVVKSLEDVHLGGGLELLGTYAGCGPDLQPWLKNAQVNRDRNLRLQYLAGMALNLQDGWSIYRQIHSYRTFPAGIFTGSERRLEALRLTLESPTDAGDQGGLP
jgi:spermidine synthase